MRRNLVVFFLSGSLLGLGCESYPEVTQQTFEIEGGAGPSSTGGVGAVEPSTGGQIVVPEGGAPGTGGTEVQSVCGNGELEPGELCDDGNQEDDDGCSADCLEQDPEYVCETPGELCEDVVICGSGVLEGDEVCDDGNEEDNDGCAADCSAVEDGWVCPRPNVACVELPVCGNGLLERGEDCDDGNATSDDGCSGTEDDAASGCQIEDGYWCPVAGEACVAIVCGDGRRSPGEKCDDGGASDGDGCDASCQVEEGWICPEPGKPCNPICGDGVLNGLEECDDGNTLNSDGCNAACRNEPGFACREPGEACVPAECGNAEVEPGEGCDDGNQVAGDTCSPTCQAEPPVTVGPDPVVNVFCGDGLMTGTEQCDDGNPSAGDGCSDACEIEQGYACKDLLERPESVSFQVTYRDFMQRNEDGGHPHMRVFMRTPPAQGSDRGIPGEVCDTTNQDTCGRLDADGKPALAAEVTEDNIEDLHPTLYAYPDAFSLWYRSTNPDAIEGYNGAIEIMEIPDVLTLDQVGGTDSEVYSFDSASFFPLDERGFGDTPDQPHNFQFTTELRYTFQYQGGESLTFRGDDDVFVYVNGRLAVDIGGIHNAQWGRVVLGDDGDPAGGDSTCAVTADDSVDELPDCELSEEETDSDTDTRFGLTRGGVYEIVLFHAERHPVASNFRLTLAGFLAPRSSCGPLCGDGEVVGWEVCDEGEENNTGEYGHCNPTCTRRMYCGDGIRQGPDDSPSGPEECDNGLNDDLYAFSSDSCQLDCTLPPYCGDGVLQAAFELCDHGDANSDTAYNGCTTNCVWGPYCGDGHLDPEETCDDGDENTLYSAAPGACGPDCEPAPYCGDGIRNGSEACDDGTDENTGEYGGCNPNCTRAPYCGDGVVQADEGEECDDGPIGSLSCTPGCIQRGDIR